MARYIDVDKLIAEYDRVHVGAPGGARKLMVEAPTADVVPKSEVEKPMFENTKYILLGLKRQIHDKAVYPSNSAGISPYISLKVVDAILQIYLNGLK